MLGTVISFCLLLGLIFAIASFCERESGKAKQRKLETARRAEAARQRRHQVNIDREIDDMIDLRLKWADDPADYYE